jgi:hypothetical protein
MHGPRPFRQRDVTAAVKAVAAAGQRVDRVEIYPDRIVVITARPGDDQPTAQNDFDKWLAENASPTKGD